jgi:hypothetical protein
MARRDGEDETLPAIDERCRASPAGASLAPVSVGAPGSGSPASEETPRAEARRREPLTASVKRIRQRVKELTSAAACHRDRLDSHAFYRLGLHKLLGTTRYPGQAKLPPSARPPVSRCAGVRTHGLNGELAHSRRKTEEGWIYQCRYPQFVLASAPSETSSIQEPIPRRGG